jgi:hypothetical protein
MLQLRQFDLQLALMGAGPLGEDIQDQASAIQHAALQLRLQVALLTRPQYVVEYDDFCTVLAHFAGYFFQLSAAHERARIRGYSGTHDVSDRVTPGGQHKLLELTRVLTLLFTGKIQVNEHSTFARIGAIKKQDYLFRLGLTGDGYPGASVG